MVLALWLRCLILQDVDGRQLFDVEDILNLLGLLAETLNAAGNVLS
jgi:hypothetical protein